MQILSKAFGAYKTNCYILKLNSSEIIIDPGQGSYNWIKENCQNILAVLNTHGHFDHSFDNRLLQDEGHKIYIHKDDSFMIRDDPFNMLEMSCEADFEVSGGDRFKFGDFEVEFMHFPGHTPGCCMIAINGEIFSGDFIFKGSIGRYDFPYSNRANMITSLKKALEIEENFNLHPGHGRSTTLKDEVTTLKYFLANA